MEMNLKKLSDLELLDKTKALVEKERELATEVLWHLKEVSDRRLYSARGFSSIFDYTVKELKYSEAAAGRRVAAMRLLVELPEVAPALENGSLNLSAVSTAQSFFRREETDQGKKYTIEEKREVLKAMAHKSKRECEKLLATLSPASAIGPEKAKTLTETHTELRIVVDEKTLQKIEKLRDLLAHQNPSGSYGKLFELIAEMALDRVDPQRKEERLQNRKAKSQSNLAPPAEPAPLKAQKTNPHFIPASVRRQVYLRDQGRCTYRDVVTGKVCGSSFKVEIDHVMPVALGGISHLQNLQSRCRSHNLWEGVVKLGKEAMTPFIKVT